MSRATGTYKGRILEHAVSATRSGYPQFVARLLAAEVYDETEKEWVQLEEVDGVPDMAYLVLCTNTQEIFHVANLREALDWTDGTFASLAKGDWTGVVVQYRVEENDYNGNVTQQVQWVRGADAPIGSCRPASDDEVKAMDQKFGGFLKNSATGAAKVTPPVPSKPIKPKPAASTKKASAKKTTTPPPASTPPIPQEQPEQTEEKPDGDAPPASGTSFFERPVTTEEETWNLICEVTEVSEESEKNVEQYWFDGKKMYDKDWEAVKKYVLEQMIPF